MYKFLSVSLIASSLAGAAQASVFDFDDLVLQDTLVSVVTSSDGLLSADLVVSANRNPDNSDVDAALIFDTENGADNDSDLQSTFLSDDGARTSNAGGVLVISENDLSSGMLPDDNQNGGTIEFTFNTSVNFTGLSIYDDATITVSSDNGASYTASVATNGRFDDFLVGDNRFFGSKVLTFDFGDYSGAIDNLQIAAVPLPAGMVLMLSAFGGFAAMRRRQKA